MSYYSVEKVIQGISRLIKAVEADKKDALFIPILSNLRKNIPKMHFHAFPELFIQLQAKDLFVFPDEKKEISAEQACLIPRGLPHKEIIEKDKAKFENIVIHYIEEGIVIHFAHVRPDKNYPQIRDLRVFYTEESFRAFQYLNDVEEFYHLGYDYSHPLVKYPFLSALSVILHTVESELRKKSKVHHKISLCKKIIQMQLHDSSLNIKVLATKTGLSVDYLGRLFQKETGCLLNHYIQQQRILMARGLLAQSNLTINQICYQVGFADPSYFTKVFKSLVKKSPKEYRKMIH